MHANGTLAPSGYFDANSKYPQAFQEPKITLKNVGNAFNKLFLVK